MMKMLNHNPKEHAEVDMDMIMSFMDSIKAPHKLEGSISIWYHHKLGESGIQIHH
jgi:hypothetical protein